MFTFSAVWRCCYLFWIKRLAARRSVAEPVKEGRRCVLGSSQHVQSTRTTRSGVRRTMVGLRPHRTESHSRVRRAHLPGGLRHSAQFPRDAAHEAGSRYAVCRLASLHPACQRPDFSGVGRQHGVVGGGRHGNPVRPRLDHRPRPQPRLASSTAGHALRQGARAVALGTTFGGGRPHVGPYARFASRCYQRHPCASRCAH